ncbi:MAG: aminodeoxychorismate/anthranilate synthase component II [Bacteroidota bacterium]|nr:aminodeoxychorismate/anthranilate synthase component II [Bacteroidota bacterium]
MHTLLIDNHDSFSYNVFHLLKKVASALPIKVISCEKVKKEDILYSRRIILSPGGGLPTEYPNLMQSIYLAEKHCPILGICLGHQALAIHFGAKLEHLSLPFHGLQSNLKTIDCPLFQGIEEVKVARYHSWVVAKHSLPNTLQTTSLSEEGHIMSFQHKSLPIWGVQFHPESFVTRKGEQMISNFFKL